MQKRWMMGLLFLVCGGILYPSLEVLFRGRTHISMALAGALCGVLIYYGNALFLQLPFWCRTLLGAAVILLVEFTVGVVCNLFLGLGVWDYTDRPPHILGQVCLRYTLLWVLLSGVLAAVVRVAERERAALADENIF